MPTRLERALPRYDFEARHTRWIAANADRVWAALTTLTLRQLRLTRPLVLLRHLNRPDPQRPLLTDGPLQLLQTDAPWYAVAGQVVRAWQPRPQRRQIESIEAFTAFDEPGWTKYLTDFQVRAGDGGVWLSTTTRGQSSDVAARRRFAVYWAVIRLPSGLIRREILRATARIAQQQVNPDGTQ